MFARPRRDRLGDVCQCTNCSAPRLYQSRRLAFRFSFSSFRAAELLDIHFYAMLSSQSRAERSLAAIALSVVASAARVVVRALRSATSDSLPRMNESVRSTRRFRGEGTSLLCVAATAIRLLSLFRSRSLPAAARLSISPFPKRNSAHEPASAADESPSLSLPPPRAEAIFSFRLVYKIFMRGIDPNDFY